MPSNLFFLLAAQFVKDVPGESLLCLVTGHGVISLRNPQVDRLKGLRLKVEPAGGIGTPCGLPGFALDWVDSSLPPSA